MTRTAPFYVSIPGDSAYPVTVIPDGPGVYTAIADVRLRGKRSTLRAIITHNDAGFAGRAWLMRLDDETSEREFATLREAAVDLGLQALGALLLKEAVEQADTAVSPVVTRGVTEDDGTGPAPRYDDGEDAFNPAEINEIAGRPEKHRAYALDLEATSKAYVVAADAPGLDTKAARHLYAESLRLHKESGMWIDRADEIERSWCGARYALDHGNAQVAGWTCVRNDRHITHVSPEGDGLSVVTWGS